MDESDPFTHSRIVPMHVRHDIHLIDRQIAQIAARDPEPLQLEALRLLGEVRQERVRRLRAMTKEETR